MSNAFELLSHLSSNNLAWLLDIGEEVEMKPGAVLIDEGQPVEHIYVLLEGVVGIQVRGKDVIVHRGPGELLGELSFLLGSPASASVRATEPARLLAIARTRLVARMSQDARFAAAVYRAFAIVNALRVQSSHGASARHPMLSTTSWAPVQAQLTGLVEILVEAERSEPVPRHLQRTFTDGLSQLALDFNALARHDSRVGREVGDVIKRKLLPYILLTRNAERWYTKPRGHALDHETLAAIYTNQPAGKGTLGALVDRAFLALPIIDALRSRRAHLRDALTQLLELHPHRDVHVTSVTTGPAQEIFDVFDAVPHARKRLSVTLVDTDARSQAALTERIRTSKLRKRIKVAGVNLLYLITGRAALPLPPQDLIFTFGLIEDFDDAFATLFVDFLLGCLRVDGRLLLGGFHPDNPSRALMEHVFDWSLSDRDRTQLMDICDAAHAPTATPHARLDDGLALIIECVKQSTRV